MSTRKIKLGNLEGSKEDVVSIIKESGLDMGDFINPSRKIKVPLYVIIIGGVLFFVLACFVITMDESNPKLKDVLTLALVATGFVNIIMVYMHWKNYTITGFVALAELILFSLAHHIHTPRDVIDKIESHIEEVVDKK